MPLDVRGHTVRLALPELPFKQFGKVRATYERVRDELAASLARLGELRDAVEGARKQDLTARADAIKAGKPDSDEDLATRKAERDLEAEQRRRAALELAVESAASDVVAAVNEKGPEWLAALADELEKRRDAEVAAVEAWARAREETAEVAGAIFWLKRFPETPTAKLQTTPLKVDFPAEGMKHEALVAHLREVARPPLVPRGVNPQVARKIAESGVAPEAAYVA